MVQEKPYYWWKSIEKTTFHRCEISSTILAQFVADFNRQYFPELVVQKMAQESTNLVRANKFLWGERIELRNKIASAPMSMITKVINSATTQELLFEYNRA